MTFECQPLFAKSFAPCRANLHCKPHSYSGNTMTPELSSLPNEKICRYVQLGVGIVSSCLQISQFKHLVKNLGAQIKLYIYFSLLLGVCICVCVCVLMCLAVALSSQLCSTSCKGSWPQISTRCWTICQHWFSEASCRGFCSVQYTVKNDWNR